MLKRNSAAAVMSFCLVSAAWAADPQGSKLPAPSMGSVQASTESKSAAPSAAPATAPAPAPAPAPAAATPSPAAVLEVFNTAWPDATAEEQVAFLEANPEIVSMYRTKWDKSTPKQRKKLLHMYGKLASRALKHKWIDATPDEKWGFLEAVPVALKRVKEMWEFLTPDQRLQIVKDHPTILRRALHHSWGEATGEEQVAFMESQADMKRMLVVLWALPGQSRATSLEAAAPADQANLAYYIYNIVQAAEGRWKNSSPTQRAEAVQRWSGWKLKQSMIGMPKGAASKKGAKKTHPKKAKKKKAKRKPAAEE